MCKGNAHYNLQTLKASDLKAHHFRVNPVKPKPKSAKSITSLIDLMAYNCVSLGEIPSVRLLERKQIVLIGFWSLSTKPFNPPVSMYGFLTGVHVFSVACEKGNCCPLYFLFLPPPPVFCDLSQDRLVQYFWKDHSRHPFGHRAISPQVGLRDPPAWNPYPCSRAVRNFFLGGTATEQARSQK